METRARSLTKGITYRIMATSATAAVAYFFTGDLTSAAQIGALDFFVKLALFYVNDRAWGRIKWGTNAEVRLRLKRIKNIRSGRPQQGGRKTN